MYHKKLIDFFKKYNMYEKDMFDYLQRNSDIIDYRDEDTRICIGCSYALDPKTSKLQKLRICIPFPYDNKTTLIAIHEIAHGIVGYKHLNKRFKKDIRLEAIPFLCEKLYINDSNDPKLIEYGKYLDSFIEEDSDETYKFALYARDILFSEYDNDLDKTDRLCKKLAFKYKKQMK